MLLNITILAAGKGTRMRSRLPKVLHHIGGKAMLSHVIDSALSLQPHSINVVVGHGRELILAHLAKHHANAPITVITQPTQLGTADAIRVCKDSLKLFQQNCQFQQESGKVLILYGDVPLIDRTVLASAIHHPENVVITASLEDPTGYGRILLHPPVPEKNDKNAAKNLRFVANIREQQDCSPEEQAVREINTGVICVNINNLLEDLDKVQLSSSGEYYLTDLIEISSSLNRPFLAVHVDDFQRFSGVNDPLQLAVMEQCFQGQCSTTLMRAGVRMQDPTRVVVRGELEKMIFGQDVFLDVGVVLEGNIKLGDGVSVGAYSMIINADIGEDVVIAPYCHIQDCVVAAHAHIGPYARLRPGTHIGESAHVGNFVEIKNSVIGQGSKANHLSYVGDADIGDRVNIGAGTITCNYDGANKFRTVIEDDAFIGSDTQLVAPVRVGKGATLGAGTTLTRDAPAHALTLSRSSQTTITQWQRPKKK